MTRIRKIDFKTIIVRDEDNARQNYLGIEELAADIAERGLLQPLIVYERKQKTTRDFILKGGFRRYKAICLLRETDKRLFAEVPIMVKSGNDGDALLDNLAENVQRKNLTPGELAFGLARAAKTLTQAEVARRLGLSPGYVGGLIRAWEAFDEPTRKAFVEGKIPSDVAMMLADKPAEEVAAVVAAAATAEAVAVESGNGNGHAAARKATREATRTRPTAKTLIAFAAEHGKENGYWLGVRHAAEWAAGKRKSVPGPS